MEPLELSGIDGRNPMGYLAALGTLLALTRLLPEVRPRLSWTVAPIPRPALHGFNDVDDVVTALDEDRQAWSGSPALFFSEDVKFSAKDQREYLRACRSATDGGRSAALASALVAERAFAGTGDGKPTDLHFAAGPQKFLSVAQGLQRHVSPDHLANALNGPWRYISQKGCKTFGWDVTDDQLYALSATKPGNEKETVPGADWLALVGLSSYPVVKDLQQARTSGNSGTWNDGKFSWPLWADPLGWRSIFPLINSDVEVQISAHVGVFRVLQAPIWRGRKGQGYGQFAPASIIWELGSQ